MRDLELPPFLSGTAEEQLARLRQHAAFEIWAPLPDGRTAVRFVTSWATREEDVDALIALL